MILANKDLRDWIEGIQAADELKVIKGAEPKEEIGGIVDIYQRKMGNPALMFEEVPGYPKSFRVIANILTSVPRINVALGLSPTASRSWKTCRKEKRSTSRKSPRRSGTSLTAAPSSEPRAWW